MLVSCCGGREDVIFLAVALEFDVEGQGRKERLSTAWNGQVRVEGLFEQVECALSIINLIG